MGLLEAEKRTLTEQLSKAEVDLAVKLKLIEKKSADYEVIYERQLSFLEESLLRSDTKSFS